MKKFYCFYCQEDVIPHGFWKFRFCPKCYRHMTDNGDGFYKVCDVCGANLEASARKCVRCGYNFSVENAVENYELGALFNSHTWLSWCLVILFVLVGTIAAMGILYVSFYFMAAAGLVLFVLLLLNMFRSFFRL